MSLTNFEIPAGSGNDYPSYATIAEADIDLAIDPLRAAAWDALPSDEAKERHLVAATRRLDLLSWKGEKTNPNQTADWPRTGIEGIDPTSIPRAIEEACALLAANVSIDNTQSTVVGASNIKRVKTKTTDTEFFTNTTTLAVNTLIDDPHIHELIKDLLRTNRSGFISGNVSNPTLFDVQGRTQGYN